MNDGRKERRQKTHASIVADEMMILRSLRFLRILEEKHQAQGKRLLYSRGDARGTGQRTS